VHFLLFLFQHGILINLIFFFFFFDARALLLVIFLE